MMTTLQEKKKLTLRLNHRVIEQAKKYAAQRNISVSELVETYFLKLEQEQALEHSPLVKQLTGILPADIEVEQVYQSHLQEKYGG